MRNIRRKQVEHNRKRKRLVCLTFGILLFIYFTLTIIIGENGLLRYLELKSTRDTLLTETKAIGKQNQDIKSQVEALKNEPDLVEEFARQYGLTREGELIFKFEDRQ
ncbi:MAG TPA: septum formation initiator family protein [Nitrospirae bacterium]|nr:cell division protein FtsB [bacterium BMS3Abin06]HDH11552.1 septum formation initiator family protein [Nitrospirota bacterium]HDL20851.1 septum formation initiator family protein [Nitrospirota bacterium]HDZ00614.1 septum formation initiator family protein [Nitrospirota bacterium]